MKMLIGGREVDASNGAVYENINPANGTVIDTVPSATAEDVETVIANAVEGQKEWAAIPFHKRMEILEFECDSLVVAASFGRLQLETKLVELDR